MEPGAIAVAVFVGICLLFLVTKLGGKKTSVTRVQVQRVQGQSYSFGQYLLYALIVFGLFAVYVVLTAGLWAGACSPTREGWQVFVFPIVAGLVVLVILTFSIGPRFFRDNNEAYEKNTPGFLKVVAFLVFVGGTGYNIAQFSSC
jgi:hypothetical protein